MTARKRRKNTMMTNKELAAKLINVAKNYKTLYVMGCLVRP